MIGQPVDVSATFAIVRLALGSVDIRLCVTGDPAKDEAAFSKLFAQDQTILTKMDFLAAHFDKLVAAAI